MSTKVGEWVKEWAQKSNIRVEYYFECTSTNDLAKSMNFENLDPHITVTETQTRGRGRGTNEWVNSTPGSALLSTWSFGLETAPQPVLTARIGLGLYRSLSSAFPNLDFALKAPNDIYLNGKKLGGLLTEVVSEGNIHRVHVGFGMNVFEKPIGIQSICLNEITNSKKENFCNFLDLFFVELTQSLQEGITGELSQVSCADLLLALKKYDTQITSIEPDGSLLFKNGKTQHWTSL